MTEQTDHDGDEHHTGESPSGRSTAPQSEYTGRDVAVGTVVAIVGLVVTFGVPLAVTI